MSIMEGKIGSQIKVFSINCQGLRDLKKQADVINYIDSSGGKKPIGRKNDLSAIKNLWEGDCDSCHGV